MIDWVDGLVFMDNEEFENLQTLVRLIANPTQNYVKVKDMPDTLGRAVKMARDLVQAADLIVQVEPHLEMIGDGTFSAGHLRRMPFIQQLLKSRDEFQY